MNNLKHYISFQCMVPRCRKPVRITCTCVVLVKYKVILSPHLQGWNCRVGYQAVPGWPSEQWWGKFCDVPENQKVTLGPNIDESLSVSLSLSLALFKYIYVHYVYTDFYLYLNRLGVLSVNRRSALEATLFSLELLHSTVIPSFGLVIFVKAWCEYVWITAPCFSPGKALGTPPGHRGRGKHLHGPIDITPLKAARPSRIEIWKRGVVLRCLPCKCYGEHLSSAPNIPNPLRDGLVVEKTHFSIYIIIDITTYDLWSLLIQVHWSLVVRVSNTRRGLSDVARFMTSFVTNLCAFDMANAHWHVHIVGVGEQYMLR